ncbi:MAG: DUF2752 domain-containing protein [Bacteroidia bacterium]|nr:DUF2752 domain-containing protein [Bacteroidia bacterium]
MPDFVSIRAFIEGGIRLIILLTPLVLLILPADFFDEGPVICPSRLLLEVECPGCGLTRATQHLIHWDWQTALDFNPLVLLTTPILAWLWVENLRVVHKKYAPLRLPSVPLPFLNSKVTKN